MFEGDSADMCAGKFPLVSIGGRAEGLPCADPGARTHIGVSVNFHQLCLWDNLMDQLIENPFELWKSSVLSHVIYYHISYVSGQCCHIMITIFPHFRQVSIIFFVNNIQCNFVSGWKVNFQFNDGNYEIWRVHMPVHPWEVMEINGFANWNYKTFYNLSESEFTKHALLE